MNNAEQRYIIEGIQLGNQANNAIADAVAAKASKMLDQALQDNFETLLQAKLSIAVQETLNLHSDRALRFAQQFLSQSKHRLAQNLIDTQHSHRLAGLQNNLNLSELDSFDTDVTAEAAQLADAAGTITLEVNENSAIGF